MKSSWSIIFLLKCFFLASSHGNWHSHWHPPGKGEAQTADVAGDHTRLARPTPGVWRTPCSPVVEDATGLCHPDISQPDSTLSHDGLPVGRHTEHDTQPVHGPADNIRSLDCGPLCTASDAVPHRCQFQGACAEGTQGAGGNNVDQLVVNTLSFHQWHWCGKLLSGGYKKHNNILLIYPERVHKRCKS